MRHIKSIILLTIVCFTVLGEAKTIRDFFVSEPDDILIVLPKRNRLDMLDYFDVGQKVATANNFADDPRDTTKLNSDNSTSKLIDVTDSYLALSLTKATQVEFKLLTTAKNDSVIMVVTTASLPAKDSHVAFFDTNWCRLNDNKFFKSPDVSDFIKKGTNKQKKNEILKLIPFHTISYTLSPDNGDITAHLNLKDIIIKEDWDVVKDYLNDSLTYKQQGLKFKLVKE